MWNGQISSERTFTASTWNSCFSTDQFGFKLTNSRSSIFDVKKSYSNNILIIGSSFAFSPNTIVGYSFSDHLQFLINQKYKDSHTFVWNMSQWGHMQSDTFKNFFALGLEKYVTHVIFINGLNDILNGVSVEHLNDYSGFSNIFTSPTIPFIQSIYQNSKVNLSSNISSFLAKKQQFNFILNALGIKTINILEPPITNKRINSSLLTFLILQDLVPPGIHGDLISNGISYVTRLKQGLLNMYLQKELIEDLIWNLSIVLI